MLSTSFIVYFIAVILLTITMLLVSHLLNPKVAKRTNNEPFESGIVGQGGTDIRWNINYYLVAISFVIFDLLTANPLLDCFHVSFTLIQTGCESQNARVTRSHETARSQETTRTCRR